VPLANAQAGLDWWFTEQVDNPVVADQAITFLRTYRTSPFFLWVHFRFPDEAGHQSGENSLAYTSSLIADDTAMGRVLDEVAALGLAADTTVFVTTDHGFEENGMGHEACTANTKNVWLASNRTAAIDAPVTAYQTSIAPTLFDLFDMCKTVTPPFPSPSLWSGTPGCCGGCC
jgi:membrane-anchored protein YejM (alkaline phosphatase superfamily)